MTVRATSSLPIVMAMVQDPVGCGLVKSLAYPGGNVTGLSNMATELYAKRTQLLKEVKPRLALVAVLWNPDHPAHPSALKELKAVAPVLSIELTFVSVRRPEQFDPAFAEVDQAKAQALYVVDDPIFFAHRTTLLGLASKAQLPTIHEQSRWPEAGAVMSYGPDTQDQFRRAALYAAFAARADTVPPVVASTAT
jgi:putative ABC transport system substrate-binding protein